MKKILTLMMAAALMIGFTACEKDDSGPGGNESNILQIGDKTYELGAACVYSYKSLDQEYRYDIFITNKVYWDNTGYWSDEDIYANAVEVNLYYLYGLGSLTRMPDGKYVYPTTGEESLTHDGSSEYMICDETGRGQWRCYGQECVENSRLEIEIKHISGNIYEIKFTGGVDEDGNLVKGYYKGEVDIFKE